MGTFAFSASFHDLFSLSLGFCHVCVYLFIKRIFFRGGCISSLIHSLCHFHLISPSHHEPSQLTYLQTSSSSPPPLTVSPGTVENAFKRSSLFCITAGLNAGTGSCRISLCFLCLSAKSLGCWVNFSPVKYFGGETVVVVAFFTLVSSPQHSRPNRQSQTFLHTLYLHFLPLHYIWSQWLTFVYILSSTCPLIEVFCS